MRIILDVQSSINDLIAEHNINVNDPMEIFRVDEIILKSIQAFHQITFDEVNNLQVLRKYLIKKHYFLTAEKAKNDIK